MAGRTFATNEPSSGQDLWDATICAWFVGVFPKGWRMRNALRSTVRAPPNGGFGFRVCEDSQGVAILALSVL